MQSGILRTLVPGGAGGAEGLSQEDLRILRTLLPYQGVQRDFARRIPDSQDPPDTGARWCRGRGSQAVRILRTLVPGGAEGLSQEYPRQSGSSGHWCQGVQRDFPDRIPDSHAEETVMTVWDPPGKVPLHPPAPVSAVGSTRQSESSGHWCKGALATSQEDPRQSGSSRHR